MPASLKQRCWESGGLQVGQEDMCKDFRGKIQALPHVEGICVGALEHGFRKLLYSAGEDIIPTLLAGLFLL